MPKSRPELTPEEREVVEAFHKIVKESSPNILETIQLQQEIELSLMFDTIHAGKLPKERFSDWARTFVRYSMVNTNLAMIMLMQDKAETVSSSALQETTYKTLAANYNMLYEALSSISDQLENIRLQCLLDFYPEGLPLSMRPKSESPK